MEQGIGSFRARKYSNRQFLDGLKYKLFVLPARKVSWFICYRLLASCIE